MSKKMILLVEDNKKVQNFNRRMLEDEGFTVECAMTLESAAVFLEKTKPAAIILDIGMPDGNGLDFLREFKKTSRIPVLMLTGYGEAKDIVLGFKTGCDDYLPKPYTFDVLLVRLLRLLKSAEEVPEAITRGLLTLRFLPDVAYIGDKNLNLSKKEFYLLLHFVQNENLPLDAENLYITVWGTPMAGDSQALKAAVSRLRNKLKGCGYTITPEYGLGYRFEQGET